MRAMLTLLSSFFPQFVYLSGHLFSCDISKVIKMFVTSPQEQSSGGVYSQA